MLNVKVNEMRFIEQQMHSNLWKNFYLLSNRSSEIKTETLEQVCKISNRFMLKNMYEMRMTKNILLYPTDTVYNSLSNFKRGDLYAFYLCFLPPW